MENKVYNLYQNKEKRKLLRKKQTETEKKLWQYLRKKQLKNQKFYRQYGINHYIVDFYCPKLKLVIELDGGQHYTENGKEYDKLRENYMKSIGVKTIRFSNLDVINNIETVIEKIKLEL